MYVFFSFLFFLCFLAMIIGLIKPSIFNKMFKNKISRKKFFVVFGGAAIVFLIISSLTTPESVKEQNKIKAQQRAEQRAERKQAAEKEKQDAEQQKANQGIVQEEKTEPVEIQQPAPEVSKTLEEKITDAINTSLGEKTNMGKQRVASVKAAKYNAAELSMYKYKNDDSIVGLLIKINSSENLTVKLQKATMDEEAAKIIKAVFPIDQNIGDIIIWSQLPVKDQYGNVKDDTAIVFSVSRALFDKINWANFDYHDLPALLTSEKRIDDRNSYFENIKF